MKVIFCTPTATLLVWITERYPEILNCDINGVSYQDGERRRYNTNKRRTEYASERLSEGKWRNPSRT
mgnify:CR=1 FL=1